MLCILKLTLREINHTMVILRTADYVQLQRQGAKGSILMPDTESELWRGMMSRHSWDEDECQRRKGRR